MFLYVYKPPCVLFTISLLIIALNIASSTIEEQSLNDNNEIHRILKVRKPVLGEPVTNGSKPLFGYKHIGTDAIFALACNYPILYYQRFVGSLRKSGYVDDIVLAVSPPAKMKPGVEEYLQKMKVIAYAFEVDCEGKDNCKFKDEFLGYILI